MLQPSQKALGLHNLLPGNLIHSPFQDSNRLRIRLLDLQDDPALRIHARALRVHVRLRPTDLVRLDVYETRDGISSLPAERRSRLAAPRALLDRPAVVGHNCCAAAICHLRMPRRRADRGGNSHTAGARVS